jgi:hypothetical protein
VQRNTPTLQRHRRTGHGYARLDGRQVWFGPYDDPEIHRRFARALAEWIANGRRLPAPDAAKDLRVAVLAPTQVRGILPVTGTPRQAMETAARPGNRGSGQQLRAVRGQR